jgi:hypothetical protein
MISLKRYVKNNGNSGNISPHNIRLMHGGLFLLPLLLLAVSAVTDNAYAQAQVAIARIEAPIETPVLVAVTYTAPVENPPATLMLRFAYQSTKLEALEVLPMPLVEDSGKSFDYELKDGAIAIVVFGGSELVPSGMLAYLKMQAKPAAQVGNVLSILNSTTNGADITAEYIAVQVTSGNVRVIETPEKHAADTEPDWSISLEELLRVVQLYAAGEYHCDGAGEDGYAPGSGAQDCTPHDADYAPTDWRISFSELLRVIQLYNAPFRMYHTDTTSEDGFAPGPFGYAP